MIDCGLPRGGTTGRPNFRTALLGCLLRFNVSCDPVEWHGCKNRGSWSVAINLIGRTGIIVGLACSGSNSLLPNNHPCSRNYGGVAPPLHVRALCHPRQLPATFSAMWGRGWIYQPRTTRNRATIAAVRFRPTCACCTPCTKIIACCCAGATACSKSDPSRVAACTSAIVIEGTVV